MFSIALASLFCMETARAEPSVDPQNRIHLGVSMVDAPSGFGFGGGFDSRLSRIVSMDIGGFASPAQIPLNVSAADADYQTYFALRHGVYVMPGLRIPHAQPKAFAFDVFVRLGGGAVWVADTDPTRKGFDNTNYIVTAEAAGMLGADGIIRFGRYGVRVSGKAIGFSASRDIQPQTWFLLRSQLGLEGFVQF